MEDIERLTNEALDLVTKSDWEKHVKHAEKIQDGDYEKEILKDSLMEPIFTLASDDSDICIDEDSELLIKNCYFIIMLN